MASKARITSAPSNALDEHIEVKDQTLIDVLFALGRVLVVLFTLGASMLAFIKTRDLAGLIQFVKTNDVVSALTTAIGLATLAYGMFKTWNNKRKLITTAAAAPNTVATVTTTAPK